MKNEDKYVSYVDVSIITKPITFVEGLGILALFGQGTYFTIPSPTDPTKHVFHIVDRPYHSLGNGYDNEHFQVPSLSWDMFYGCFEKIQTLSRGIRQSNYWAGSDFTLTHARNGNNASDMVSFVTYGLPSRYLRKFDADLVIHQGLYDVVIHPIPQIYKYLLNIWMDENAIVWDAKKHRRAWIRGCWKKRKCCNESES